jgi:hypothetical protein
MKIEKEKFQIQHHSFVEQEDKLYTLIDDNDFIDDSGHPRTNRPELACAKKVFGKKSKHITDQKSYNSYYIKCNPNKEVFNPIKLHSSIEKKETNDYIDTVCKTKWNFLQVDEKIFRRYLGFLKSKNIRVLKEINRSLK